MKKFTDLVLYALLMIHFPLFYYSHNLFDLSPISFVELLAITFSLGFIIVGISIIFSKIIKKPTSPIAVLIIIFLFFSYRSFYEFFIDNGMEVRHLFLLPVFFIIFIISLKYAPKLSTKFFTSSKVFSGLLCLYAPLGYNA